MPEKKAHPSPEQLSAYNLGLLPPEEASSIENHISECEPCCDTIMSLSSDDTFVGILKEARQLPSDQALNHHSSTSPMLRHEVPAQLAEHPRYEIIRLIGKGGMGDVYEARHRKMERRVALKVINRQLFQKAEAVNRFHREVKAAAQLSHPNIVTSHDADQAGDFHFMVMEFVDGVDLSQVVKDHGALPIADACDYIRQAAIGLQHAHECGMVHRDIKPHNLMVTKDGTIKILDFGLASLTPDAVPVSEAVEARSDLTAAGAIMGTPDFISPEQANDARQVDIRSDIYSLGATLYYLLSGRVPFGDGSVMHKLKSHAHAEPAPLDSVRDDVPEELVTIVLKMMAKDPKDRYLTPSEVAQALEAFLQVRQRDEEGLLQQATSGGGNNSGTSGQKRGDGDSHPGRLPIVAKWLFYTSLLPLALVFLDNLVPLGLFSADLDWFLYCLVASIALSTIGGIVSGVHRATTSDQNDHRIFRWTTDQTLVIAAILAVAGVYFGSTLSQSNEPYLTVSAGAGIDGEGWYFSSGHSYLKQDEPGVLFGLYEDPSGKRGFTYIVLVRDHGGDRAEVSDVSDAGLRFDGRIASIREGFAIEGKGITLDLEYHVGRSGIESTRLAVDGEALDASLGQLFLVDIASDRATWHQVEADLPVDLPAPEALVRDTKLVAALAEQIKDQLAKNHAGVGTFLAGKLPAFDNAQTSGTFPTLQIMSVEEQSTNLGNDLQRTWKLQGRGMETIFARILHIADGERRTACQTKLEFNDDNRGNQQGQLVLRCRDRSNDQVELSLDLSFENNLGNSKSEPASFAKGLGLSSASSKTLWDGQHIDEDEIAFLLTQAQYPSGKKGSISHHMEDLESMERASTLGAEFLVVILHWEPFRNDVAPRSIGTSEANTLKNQSVLQDDLSVIQGN